MNEETQSTVVAPAPQPEEHMLQRPSASQLENLKTDITLVADRVKVIVIKSNNEFNVVETITANAAGYIKEVERFIKPYKDAAHEFHKSITALENELTNIAKEAKSIGNRKVGLYLEQMDSLRRKEQAAADKLARQEKEEQDLADAELVRQNGGDEAAEAYLEEAVREAEEKVYVESYRPPTRKGTSVRKTYTAKVVDESKVPLKFRPIDQAALDREARNFKDAFAVDGCKLMVESKGVVRGGQ